MTMAASGQRRPTTVALGSVATRTLARSIRRAVRAIAPSLGPGGRAVIIHHVPAAPVLLTDGYAIARGVADESGAASLGARVLKETLFEVDRDLGDGTATTAVLLDALFAGSQRILRSGIPGGRLADALVSASGEIAKKVAGFHLDLPPDCWAPAVARTAVADEGLGQLIVPAFLNLGPDGLIQVEEGSKTGTEVVMSPGATIDATLVSRLLSDTTDRIFVRLERPHIVVADADISDFGALVPVLEGFAARDKALLIVAREVSGTALQTLVTNKVQAGLRVAALRISAVVERGYEALEDAAVAVGAELISERLGTSLSALRPHMLGRAVAVEVGREFAVIIGGEGRADQIEARRAELRRRIARERYLSYDREQLERRLARLSTGFARILVGGATDAERQSRLGEARKAVAALRAARSGVVPGAGVMLLRLSKALRSSGRGDPAAAGAERILAAALMRVPEVLVANSGADARFWLGKVMEAAEDGIGFDARSRVMISVAGAGILDPASILRGAIERAASAAASLLRAEATVS